VISFRAMSASIEAPAAFRNAAGEQGPLALVREGIHDIRSRRRLVRYLVQADMRKRGADTILGNLWWVLDPLLQMLVYVVLVTILSRGKGIEDYPLFIFAAILPWKWFTAVVGDAATSIVSQERLIKQIAFPKIVLPVAAATSGVVGFVFGLIPLAGIMLLYADRISPFILLIPVVAVVQYVFTLAFSLLVAAGNVFFRDLGNVLRHVTRLWWFLSPGLYSLSTLDEVSLFREHSWLRTLIALNPFSILFEGYRRVIYGSADGGGSLPGWPDWTALGGLLIASVVFLAVATIVFKRLEPNFAKVL
jgi:ABC-type polysaccharide/polyol phosphate export permease